MPIKFRCPHCEQFLGISRGKAGALTDCPSCGRTIRIPELDGSVKPLPGGELDHQDAELAHALDALAQIASRSAGEAGGVAVKPAPIAAAPAVASPVREVQPQPIPEPIAIEPALPAEAVPAPAPKGGGKVRAPARDPLDELAGLATPAQLSARYSDRRRTSWSPGIIVAAAVGGLVLFAAGFLVGRVTTSAREGAAPQAAPPIDSSTTTTATTTSTPPAPAAGLTPALTGRITYDVGDGGTKPDAGARIIALPEQRQGTATIAVIGFRAGADDADQQLARASLRALGGDFAVADDQGQYTIQLPAAGAYQLLLMSRHQPRDDAEPLDAGVQRALAAYFDRPTGLIGAIQYDFSTFRFQGESAAPRDHTFQRQ